MRWLIITGVLIITGLMFLLTSQSSALKETELSDSAPASENLRLATNASLQSQPAAKEIHIKLGNFFFEGPEGRSGSESKTPTEIEPKVIVRLKNGEHVKLIFENPSNVVDHEVISPLFSAPEEKRFSVPPLGKAEIEITPNFLTVADGGILTFHLVCHVRHGQTTDHYKLGMHALIEVVP